MEQALADYATIIRALPDLLGTAELPVIAFGGSYGGMCVSSCGLKCGTTSFDATADPSGVGVTGWLRG